MYKKITIIIVLALLSTGAYYYFRNNQPLNIQWRTEKAEKGDIKILVNTTGTLQADTTVDVGTQVSGTISKLYVDFNTKVKKGQLVALIDTTTLAAGVDNAEASLKSAEAQLELARENFNRTKQLYTIHLSAKSDYDQALANLEVAQSKVEVEKASVKAAKLDLSHAKIFAPISGVVINKNVNVGQTVAASYNTPTLFTIANDLSKMQVQADIDEADIGLVKLNQPVDFTVAAYPDETFKGKVSQIRLNPTTTNNVVTYTVVVDVKNPELKLMPGMTANIAINTAQSSNIVRVPAMALQFTPPAAYLKKLNENGPAKFQGENRSTGSKQFNRSNGRGSSGMHQGRGSKNKKIYQPGDKAMLWVKDGENVKPVHVTVGLSDGSYTAVTGELNPGANVIIGAVIPGQSQLTNNPFSRRR